MSCVKATTEPTRPVNLHTYQETLADLVTLSLSRLEAFVDALEHRAGQYFSQGCDPEDPKFLMARELANLSVIGDGLCQAARFELLEALGFIKAELGEITFERTYHVPRRSQPSPVNFVKVGLVGPRRKVA